jgi:hypothetical protein
MIQDTILSLLGAGFVVFTVHMAQAQVQDAQATATLNLISTTTNDICTQVPLINSSEGVELTGDAKLKVAGIVKKFADIGVQSAVTYNRTVKSQVVLQQDLASAIAKSNDCRLSVFNTLVVMLLHAPVGVRGDGIADEQITEQKRIRVRDQIPPVLGSDYDYVGFSDLTSEWKKWYVSGTDRSRKQRIYYVEGDARRRGNTVEFKNLSLHLDPGIADRFVSAFEVTFEGIDCGDKRFDCRAGDPKSSVKIAIDHQASDLMRGWYAIGSLAVQIPEIDYGPHLHIMVLLWTGETAQAAQGYYPGHAGRDW